MSIVFHTQEQTAQETEVLESEGHELIVWNDDVNIASQGPREF
jgi:hypothetical protein